MAGRWWFGKMVRVGYRQQHCAFPIRVPFETALDQSDVDLITWNGDARRGRFFFFLLSEHEANFFEENPTANDAPAKKRIRAENANHQKDQQCPH